jgi:hypothetical protein
MPTIHDLGASMAHDFPRAVESMSLPVRVSRVDPSPEFCPARAFHRAAGDAIA